MQGANVSLQRGAADDLDVWAQAATIDREVHVQIVVVWRNDDGWRFFYARFFSTSRSAALPMMYLAGS
jgi:hypothetical protein